VGYVLHPKTHEVTFKNGQSSNSIDNSHNAQSFGNFLLCPKKMIDGSKKCNDDNEFARVLLFDAKYFKPHGNLGYGNCLYHSISNFIVFYGDQPPTEWEKYKGNKGTVILTE